MSIHCNGLFKQTLGAEQKFKSVVKKKMSHLDTDLQKERSEEKVAKKQLHSKVTYASAIHAKHHTLVEQTEASVKKHAAKVRRKAAARKKKRESKRKQDTKMKAAEAKRKAAWKKKVAGLSKALDQAKHEERAAKKQTLAKTAYASAKLAKNKR